MEQTYQCLLQRLVCISSRENTENSFARYVEQLDNTENLNAGLVTRCDVQYLGYPCALQLFGM